MAAIRCFLFPTTHPLRSLPTAAPGGWRAIERKRAPRDAAPFFWRQRVVEGTSLSSASGYPPRRALALAASLTNQTVRTSGTGPATCRLGQDVEFEATELCEKAVAADVQDRAAGRKRATRNCEPRRSTPKLKGHETEKRVYVRRSKPTPSVDTNPVHPRRGRTPSARTLAPRVDEDLG